MRCKTVQYKKSKRKKSMFEYNTPHTCTRYDGDTNDVSMKWNEEYRYTYTTQLYTHVLYIYIYSVVCFCFFWIIMCVARELGWIIIFGLEYFFLLWLCESSFWLIQKAVKTNLLMIRGYLVLAVFPEECIPWVFLASLEMLIFE